MNYLAHLYLADGTDDSLIGNLLGDFVKGRPGDRYGDRIAAAILFHRRTDTFADAHPCTRRSRNRVGPARRRVAGIIVDLCYDHFLARHWARFSDVALSDFTGNVYEVLLRNQVLLPQRLQELLPRLVGEDWLGSYRQLEHVGVALDRISSRLRRGEALIGSIDEVSRDYDGFERDFLQFFPELQRFARDHGSGPGYYPSGSSSRPSRSRCDT